MSEERNAASAVKKKNPYYQAVAISGRLFFHSLIPIRYIGLENVCEDGPFILISNHLSAIDPVAIACGLKKCEVTFLGKKEITNSRIGKWFADKVNMISVERHSTDLAAMRKCMRVIKDQGVLGIFPEGTRHHEGVMEHIENGTAMIALRSKARIQPVLISDKLRLFRKNYILYGKPMDVNDLYAKGVDNEVAMMLDERIRSTYRELLKEAEKFLKK